MQSKDKLVRVNLLNAKRTRPVNLGKRLTELAQMTMHNPFHHEALGYARELKNKALSVFFTEQLSEIDEQMDANRMFP